MSFNVAPLRYAYTKPHNLNHTTINATHTPTVVDCYALLRNHKTTRNCMINEIILIKASWRIYLFAEIITAETTRRDDITFALMIVSRAFICVG